MSIRKVNFVPGEYYHIYNRGNSKQEIFKDKQDYGYFLKLLFISKGEEKFKFSFLEGEVYDINLKNKIVAIGAYCLMPNHFHILITQTSEGGISKFMHKVASGYSHYYNKKYDRTGSLFEGKFKSEHSNNDRYLKYLFSYIHLNPIKLIQKDWKEKGVKNKKEALEYLNKYLYSSYLDFVGEKRIQNKILDLKEFPNYFPTTKNFRSEIFDWLKIEW